MNLSDISSSKYIAADDHKVGSVLPIVEIERVDWSEVPVPNSQKKDKKVVAWFKGMTKGWVINKTVGRTIGRIVGSTTNIETTWVGVKVQFIIVGDVRRPDGTKGNAFRLHQAWAADKPATTTPAEPAKQG